MQEFYKKALLITLCLLIATLLCGYLCFHKTFLKFPLFPAPDSSSPWHLEQTTDATADGSSLLTVNDQRFSLDFDFNISNQAKYPHVGVSIVFGEQTRKPKAIDLSGFNKAVFNVKCSTENTLSFSVTTHDKMVSNDNDPLSYRTSSTFFSCNDSWQLIQVDLTRLETPKWWFDMYRIKLSEQKYELNKTSKITISNTTQTPFNVDTNVQLTDLTIIGRNWIYLKVYFSLAILAWISFALWLFGQHTQALVRETNRRKERDRPLFSYQELTIDSTKDKDRTAILNFMTTKYHEPDLTLEGMEATIGISKNKINDILKAQLGFTFTSYLNKLRLKEASRLLSERECTNIAEVAYSVGYKNPSYFNKLFKEEYNCTPKSYKSLHAKTSNEKQLTS